MVKRLTRYPKLSLPGKVLSKLSRYKYVFNPSYLNFEDQNYLAIRVWEEESGKIIALLFYWRCTENIICKSFTELCNEFYLGEKIADPKLVLLKNSVHCTFNTGYTDRGRNQIYLVRLKGAEIKELRMVKFPSRQRIEKNWAFFDKDDEIYAIYSLNPFRILKSTKVSNTSIEFENFLESNISLKNYSIGTQCFSFQGRLFFIAHRKVYFKRKRAYLGRLMSFDPLEFETLYKGRHLFIHSIWSLIGSRHKFNKNLISCTYFSGLSQIDGKWIISYGINDICWNLVKLKHSQLWP